MRSQPHPGRDPAHAKQAARNTKGLLVYILDVPATLNQNQVVIDLARRQRRPAGDWGPLKPWWHAPAALLARYDPEDRDLLALLEEARGIPPAPPPPPRRRPAAAVVNVNAHVNGSGVVSNGGESMGTRRYVLRNDQAAVVERLARTGRLRLRRTEGEEEPPTVRWDDGPPWRFALDIRPELGGKRWAWRGSLRRGRGADGPGRAARPGPRPADPGGRPRGPVRRRRGDALDRPAPPREGDRLRRPAAGHHARAGSWPSPASPPRSWSRRSSWRRSTPRPGPA